MSGRLNYDVWLAISSHLPVQSILNLSYVRQLSHVFTLLKASDQSWISLRSQCCNYLYDAMNTRSVWNTALGDILDVIPSPSLRDAMPFMSSRELKERATQMARVDGVFDKDIIHPTRVKQHHLGFAEVRAEVAPGGDWIVTVHEDYAGSLCLYRGESLGQTALATAKRPDDSCLREGILGYDSLFLSYSEGKHLAVVSEPFCFGCNEFRVYHIDVCHSSIQLLSRFTRPKRYCNFAFGEGLLVAGWVDGTYFLAIRKISLCADDVDREVIMDLGPDMDFDLMTILCPHMILLSASQRLYLYSIPELESIPAGGVSSIVPAMPLAEYDETILEPCNRSIWSALCNHHSGRLSTLTFSLHGQCCLTVLPLVGRDSDTFVHHSLDTYISRGSSRAIWVEENRPRVENLLLRGSTHHTKPDNYSGYLRLGRSRAPDPSRIWVVSVGELGLVEDLSWDEQSGRICVVFLLANRRHLLLADLI